MDYPMYRICQWIDTSEEAMNKEQATIIFGIQTKRAVGEKFMHVAKGSVPMHFATVEEASAACESFRNADHLLAKMP
jgi:hypothetical protein